MTSLRLQFGMVLLAGAMLPAATPATVAKKKPATTTAHKPVAKARKRIYRSSAGKAAPSAAKRVSAKATPAKTTSTKPASIKTAAVRHTAVVHRPPPVAAKVRLAAHESVFTEVARGAEIPVENAAALVPFFELLYRHQKGEIPGPVRILHYGDSHTAADEWTGDLRSHFQEKFGDGGSGYSFAGRPWNGYRREDVRTGSTRGWHTDGLVGRSGDGMYGLGGVSMTTTAPHEAVYLLADGQKFELFYLQQPGGGSLQIYDNGNPVDRISTDGEEGPGYYHYDTVPGTHKFEVETLDRAPVRLFGWVAENSTGVTYETLGINGAAASIILDWNEALLRSNIERRNPSLIVLAYGTNEAGRKDWTLDSYRDMYVRLIGRLRESAPAATILVIGPPDRFIRTRRGWLPMDQIDTIIEAQRQAAAETGCAFWDERAKMGGKGSMQQWVLAGMAQYDHVHFTAPGYKMLGDAVFRDLMSQYDLFLKARAEVVAAADNGKIPAPVK